MPRTLPDPIETHLGDFRAAVSATTLAVLDWETSDVRPRVAVPAGLGAYLPDLDRVFYLNVGHTRHDPDVPLYRPADLAHVIGPFLLCRTNQVVMHNAPYDLRVLRRIGLDVRCRVSDTLILTHRLDENLRSQGRESTHRAHLDRVTYGLKELTLIYFDCRPPTLHGTVGALNTLSAPPADVARYCAQDVINTFNLYERAVALLADEPVLARLVRTIDDPNNAVLARMMWEGVGIDVTEARRQRDSYDAAIQRCREAIWETIGKDWPLDKPADLVRVLRHLGVKEELGYDPFADPWASTTDPRTADDYDPSVTMELLLDLHGRCADPDRKRVLALILSKWQMQQRLSAFVNPLPELVRYTDGRLYLDRFASTLVTTRFSSSPNIQNLPKRADKVGADDGWRADLPPGCAESHTTRNLFVARPGHVLVSIDLSAAEPRYLAMLFQQAIREKDDDYHREVAEVHARRRELYPVLMARMEGTRKEYRPPICHDCGTRLFGVRHAGRLKQRCFHCKTYPLEIQWPSFTDDPLWQVFKNGGDPYNALMTAMDQEGYGQAKAAGAESAWLADNRWRGKLAFLALAYGSQAETLAPSLEWTVERTQQAIDGLEARYATLKPLRGLTLLRMIHLGMVRNLWGRPRRINGYFQLAGTEPVTVRFHRQRPNPRTYTARIIPLGSTRQGVQAFVEECSVERPDGTLGLVLAGNPDGTVRHASRGEPIVRAPHFNRLPFRNLNFAQIDWVKDEHGLIRYLPKQERGLRQAFNAMCQSTGADHLRWLMNRMDRWIRRRGFDDCKLILTVHDSLVYEVPDGRQDAFIRLARPVVRKRPPWATFDIEVDIEVGRRFGEMKKVK